jgi:hypothetical protein
MEASEAKKPRVKKKHFKEGDLEGCGTREAADHPIEATGALDLDSDKISEIIPFP